MSVMRRDYSVRRGTCDEHADTLFLALRTLKCPMSRSKVRWGVCKLINEQRLKKFIIMRLTWSKCLVLELINIVVITEEMKVNIKQTTVE